MTVTVYDDSARARVLRTLNGRRYPAILTSIASSCDLNDDRGRAAVSSALKLLVKEGSVIRTPIGRWGYGADASRYTYQINPNIRGHVERHYGVRHYGSRHCSECGVAGHYRNRCPSMRAS